MRQKLDENSAKLTLNLVAIYSNCGIYGLPRTWVTLSLWTPYLMFILPPSWANCTWFLWVSLTHFSQSWYLQFLGINLSLVFILTTLQITLPRTLMQELWSWLNVPKHFRLSFVISLNVTIHCYICILHGWKIIILWTRPMFGSSWINNRSWIIDMAAYELAKRKSS